MQHRLECSELTKNEEVLLVRLTGVNKKGAPSVVYKVAGLFCRTCGAIEMYRGPH